MLPEDAGKMALVGKAGEVGDFGEGISGRLHELDGFLDALLADIIAEG